MPGDNPYQPQKVNILDIIEETSDAKTFEVAFVDTRTQKDYCVKPGQFNMIGQFGFGEAPISASSIVDRERFQHTIRRVGSVTGALDRLRPGDTFWIRGPYGNGWPMQAAQGKNLLLIGGGMGLAPLRPVIQSVAENRNSYGDLEILYGARTPGDGLYQREYQRWKDMPATQFRATVDTVPDGVKWEHDVGLVTKLLEKMDARPENTVTFICGPEVMMRFVVSDLCQRGFTPTRIFVSLERRMNCGIAKCGLCQIGSKFVCRDGPVFSYAELRDLTETIF